MDFDMGSFMASLLVSSIGFVAFMYGKKQRRGPQMIAGLLMMVYPYFVPNVWLMLTIAAGILGGLYMLVRMGA